MVFCDESHFKLSSAYARTGVYRRDSVLERDYFGGDGAVACEATNHNLQVVFGRCNSLTIPTFLAPERVSPRRPHRNFNAPLTLQQDSTTSLLQINASQAGS